MEPHALWPGCDAASQHQLLQHLQQQQQAQLQQQQLSIMLGQHGNLAPLVGQQISQLSSMLPVGSSHQSPPALNMMLGGANMAALFQNHGGMGQVQSPPSGSQGGGPGYLLLSAAQQQQQQRHAAEQQQGGGGGMPPALSPNSTPGIQMPGPPATPPIMGMDERSMYLGRIMQQPGMDKFGMEGLEESQQMAWKGMQGGILAEMFPSMEQRGGGPQMAQFHHPHDPRLHQHHQAAAAAAGQHMAQLQAQENLARLHHHQQQQQQQQAQQQKQQQFHHALQGHHHLYQQEMRGYAHLMPAQSPPAAPMQFHHGGGPPGPRPRPVGGDDTSPGFTPEIPIPETAGTTETGNNKDDLVIGSWNEECEKEGGGGGGSNSGSVGIAACPPPQQQPPPGLPPNMNLPPPNQLHQRRSPNNEAFFGTFHVSGGNGGGGRGSGWGGGGSGGGIGRKDEEDSGGVMYGSDYGSRGRSMGRGGMDHQARGEDSDVIRGGGMRGRPLMRGGPRGRGVMASSSVGRTVDHNQEKADGKSAAIEETKALMAKMRLEEKEAKEKFRKKQGLPDEEEGEGGKGEEPAVPEVQPGAYRPREKRGRDDRKDGARARIQSSLGRGGNVPRGGGMGGVVGRGGGLPLHQFSAGGGGGLPNPLFGMPGGPGEFRTPPFPGLEGFLAHHHQAGLGAHFPPGFPPHLAQGFAPGIFPGGYPGAMRGGGRGGGGGLGFNRGGRGFPAGFPPRGFPPPLIAGGRGGNLGRGGMGGRGSGMGGGYPTGGSGPPRGRDRGKNDGGGGGGSVDAAGAAGSSSDDTGHAEEMNPLLNAITNPGKEADTADGEADEANQPKNLFSEQGTLEGQLALLATADDLKARLSDQLVRGLTECMVCLERVKQTHATWDCHNCYQVFHIHCIKKWAKTARTESGGWRCPGCQSVYPLVPRDYLCFCRKVRDPEWNRNEGMVPHSCGEVCGRRRAAPCPHSCVELCHAGPCPPCMATIPVTCPCGKENRRMKCGEEFTCESECGKVVNCGAHTCPDVCHQGPCYDCHKKIEQACYCGKCVREVVCTETTARVRVYSCGETCEKSRDCEQHQCDAVCHPGSCQPCLLTPTRVTRCPCGKIPLEQLYERDHVPPRTSCLDPVPTCGQTCGFRLECGPPAQHHTCSALCHSGPCPVCPKTTSIRCRCGNMDKEIPCCELTGHPDDARCEKRCQKKRTCGRHKCGQLCCTELEHLCTQICGKQLSCGLHRCEELCHKGNCKTCPRVSFEELTCTCGTAVIYPPVACGTRPPECREMCTRSHACSHSVTHSCHSEDNCPPCTQLTTKMCYGGHEERKNVACLVEGISCGKPCSKPLPCARHFCIRICHAGGCTTAASSPSHQAAATSAAAAATCSQPCTELRPGCGHPCGQPCHSPPCPDTTCSTQVRVSCECGHRQATISCAENSYARMTTALLATRMADVQAGNTVDLKELVRKDKKLECTEECSQIERNRRMALALQIRNPELSSKITPRYSEFMKDFAKKDPKFCAQIHDELTKLVQLAKESKQKSRIKSFDCMNREKRQLVHEYAELFGCESESFDAEPKRNVVATAFKDKSWLPSISLVDFVQKQKKVPAPVSSSVAPSPVFTSLSKASSPPQEKENKIDWFD